MTIAWHGEPELKRAALARVREDQRYDRITQGVYWSDGRGCNLGCLTRHDQNTHEWLERLFGIEQRIGYWLEAVFEGLPEEECSQWVLDSTEAIPVGADMSKCHHHFGAWLMLESGLLHITPQNRACIEEVGRLHRESVTAEVSRVAWSAARSAASAAWSAALSAAWSAALSAASAAWSAALSAAWSAALSAASAAWSAAWSAAESAAWRKIADKSLEIFRAAPVVSKAPVIEPDIRKELCCRGLWCPDGELVAV